GPMQVYAEDGSFKGNQTNVFSLDRCNAVPSVMYCGSEPGEVYKSVDSGTTWVNVSFGIPSNWGTSSVAVDPFNPDIAFAGGGDDLYQTIDGGLNWTLSFNTAALNANEIHIHRTNSDTILVAGAGGVYRSADGGSSWSTIFNDRAFDIQANPLNPDKLYLVMDNLSDDVADFFVSTDGGFAWAQQTTGWYSSSDPARDCYGARIAVSEADTTRVYAYLIGLSKAGDSGYIGLFRSNDGGYSWTNPIGQIGGPYSTAIPNLAVGSDTWDYNQGFYNCAIMASNSDADQILIGGLNMWTSVDSGVTFQCVNGYQCNSFDMHVDMQDFRAFGNEYWASTDGGIYKSTDFFNSQPSVQMTGIHGSDFWGFGTGWNYDILVGGLYHNGNAAYYQDYAPGQFLNLGGGEAPTGYVNPGTERQVYTSDVGSKILPENIGDPIINASMGIAPNESYWAAESSEMEFHPNCYNIIYLGKDNQIMKSTDGGGLYSVLYSGLAGATITYLEISRKNPEKQYAIIRNGSVSAILKTFNDWSTVVTVAVPSVGSHALITLDPKDDDHLWVAMAYGSNGNKIYESFNGGIAWTNITSPELDGQSIHSIFHVGGTDGGVYVGTNLSVYYRNNTMTNWTVDDAGLPAKISTDILKPFYRDGKIRMASYGKGIWESPLFEIPTEPIAEIMVNSLQALCAVDTFYFDDHSMLNHNSASWSWTFQNANISTSNLRNPAVQFNGVGTHLVTLTVMDVGANSSSDSLYININTPAGVDIAEDFETVFPPAEWSGASTGNLNWEQTSNAGGFGLSPTCMMVDNYNVYGWGDHCDIIAPLDFTTAPNGWLSFDVAYARYSGGNKDSLEVLVSDDCGISWTSVYFKSDADLPTAPDYSAGQFIPASSEWRKDSIDLASYVGVDNLRVAFRNYGGYGQALYVDNINLGGSPISIEENEQPFFQVYPNPISADQEIRISTSDVGKMRFSLFSSEGKLKYDKSQDLAQPVDLKSLHLATGLYLYTVKTEGFFYKGRIVIK
ncbi:MAG: hypothetical protein ACI9J3_003422, partial [Parvicellaceae bacterium]